MLRTSHVDHKWVDLMFKYRPQIYGVFTSDHLEDRAEREYYQSRGLSKTHCRIPYGEGNVRQGDKTWLTALMFAQESQRQTTCGYIYDDEHKYKFLCII